MDSSAPHLTSSHALSMTTIASKPAPTGICAIHVSQSRTKKKALHGLP
ncbi:hypothetical protein PG5_51390 [Pseudomonas sp. G5(2012)]|nr:hypothetical protein PG5_51390 [Pseudomonas sp. G5(2012)]